MSTDLTNVPAHPQLPAWMQNLREAIASSVQATDIEAMVQAQVAKAKKGDEKACRFVLEYLLGSQGKPATVVQNNFHITPPADQPMPARPVIAAVAQRVIPDLRHKMYALLEVRGPLTSGQVAANLGAEVEDVERVLRDIPWFTREKGGVYAVGVKLPE